MATAAGFHKDVVNGLVSALSSALTAATVYDGPTVGRDFPGKFVIVGFAGDDQDDSGPAYTYSSDFDSFGGAAAFRRQSGDVVSLVVCESGDNDVKSRRDECLDLVSGFEAAVNGTGLGVAGVLWAHVTDVEVSAGQGDGGAFAEARVTVRYRANVDPLA